MGRGAQAELAISQVLVEGAPRISRKRSGHTITRWGRTRMDWSDCVSTPTLLGAAVLQNGLAMGRPGGISAPFQAAKVFATTAPTSRPDTRLTFLFAQADT